MGIFRLKKHSVLIPLLSLSLLTGCGTTGKKTLNASSVQFAFDNVNDALEVLSVDNNNYDTNLGYGYRDIFDQFTGQDYVGSYPRDLDYNDEPFIQFRYLKGILDDRINDFTFGLKYYDTQTKTINFDFSTAKKDNNKANATKVLCSSVIGADIKVNSFNQIHSNVVFQNNYTLTNGAAFSTNRYVNFMIDYDFSKEGVNFLFKAYTRNNELGAPYVGYMTYQYDHIRVVNGALVEYRRFNIESSTELTPDETHSTFESYVKDGIAYRVDSVKWFVDGGYRVTKNMTATKQIIVGNLLYDLGMFEPFSYAEFLNDLKNNQPTNTSSIYNMISNKIGGDIQYLFLTKNESNVDHVNEANNPHLDPSILYPNFITGIDACYENGTHVPTYLVDGETKIKNLFQGFEEMDSLSYVYVPIWYVTADGPYEQINYTYITNSLYFTLYFEIYDNINGAFIRQQMTSSYSIKEAYSAIADSYGLTSNDTSKEFNVVVYEKENGFSCVVPFELEDSLLFIDKIAEFPQKLINFGVPKYEGKEVTEYTMRKDSYYSNGYGCLIDSKPEFRFNEFETLLFNNGFSTYLFTHDSNGLPLGLYIKSISDDINLFVKISCIDYYYGLETYLLRTYKVPVSNKTNLSYTFPTYLSGLGLPKYKGNMPVFDFTNDGSGRFFIYNSSLEELTNYFNDLMNAGFAPTEANSNDGTITFRTLFNEGQYYLYLDFYYYDEYMKDFVVYYRIEENPNYSTFPTITSMYMTSYLDGTWNSNYALNSVKLAWYSDTSLRLESNKYVAAGKEFKFIANGDWSVKNPSSSYTGFGYSDVNNIYLYDTIFERGSNNSIIVKQNCLLMVNVYLYSDHISIEFNATVIQSF